MTTFDTEINSWVQAVQFHDAKADQLSLYNAQLQAGSSNTAVQQNIISEGQTLANVNPVVRMYQAAFGRIPDLAGERGWVNQLQSGANNIPSMAEWFANAPEFANLYNGANSQTPANKIIVDALYFNILKRAPDAQGEAFWISSGLKAGQLLAAFSESAEFIGTSTPQAQGLQQLNINGAYPNNVYTSLFATPSYSQVISGNVGLKLTPNVDNFTGNVFDGNLLYNTNTATLVQTITTGDNLTGTGTNPTLKGQLGGNNVAPAPVTITTNGVQTLVLQSQAAAATLGGSLTGVTTVTNNGSTALLTVGGLQNALTNLNVQGIVNGSGTFVTVANTVLTTGAPAIAVSVSSSSGSLASGSGAGAITIASTGTSGYKTINLTSTGNAGIAANVVAAITATSTGTPTSDTSLTIAGDTALVLGAVDPTLTSINAGALTAGGMAFGQNLTLGAPGTGLALNGTAVTVTGGSGVDKFYVSNFGSAYTINGGTGISNTLVLTGTAGVSGGAATNFKTLELAGLGVVTGNNAGTGYGATNVVLNLSGITGLGAIQIDGATAGNTGTVTIVMPSLTANALTLNLVGNGLVGTENFNPITFAGVSGSNNTLTENISNQGVTVNSNAITVSAQTLTGFSTLNFNISDQASAGVTTIGAITSATLTTEKIASSGSVTLTNVAPSLTTLDTSGVTGIQTIPAIIPAANVTGFNLKTGVGNATIAGFTDHAGATPLTLLTVSASGNLTLPITNTLGITTEVFSQTGGASFLITVPIHDEPSLTSLSFSGNVQYQGKSINPGAAVPFSCNGASNDANVRLQILHAGLANDIITLGNGNNKLYDTSIGALNISCGSGYSTCDLAQGNGINILSFAQHTSSLGSITETAAGVITAGTHDTVRPLNTSTSLITSTSNYMTISGFVENDQVGFSTGSAVAVTTIAANTDPNLTSFLARPFAANTNYQEIIGDKTYLFANDAAVGNNIGDQLLAISGLHLANTVAVGPLGFIYWTLT